jgi:hypothetical protein
MRRALVVVVSLIAALACSTLQVSYDYDRSADFSKFKTWSLKDDGSISNPLLLRRLENAVNDQMTKRGLTRNNDNPDIWVAAHTRMSSQTQIQTFDSGWGYGWGWRGGYGGGGMSTSTVQQIPVGTLIVDIVDAQRKELAWRGTATDTLSPTSTPEEKDQKLQEAVSKMFANFPPPSAR